MQRLALCLAAPLVLATSLAAQSRPYNPYAPTDDFIAPVKPDGELNWPSFFKSAGMEAKYQRYFRMGSCVGTKASTNEMLRDNKVDVNSLPVTTSLGAAIRTQLGIVRMRDAKGKPLQVVTHPAGVTKIRVTGRMSPAGLHAGMALRLLTTVDEHGAGLTPLHELEAITLAIHASLPTVEPNHKQVIAGTILRLAGTDQIRLQVDSGKLHRLTFQLADDAVIRVDGSSLDLIAAGDRVSAVGHVYSGIGVVAPTVFASKVEVTKAPIAY